MRISPLSCLSSFPGVRKGGFALSFSLARSSSVCALLISWLLHGCRSRGVSGGSGEVMGVLALGTWCCWGPPALGGLKTAFGFQ